MGRGKHFNEYNNIADPNRLRVKLRAGKRVVREQVAVHGTLKHMYNSLNH